MKLNRREVLAVPSALTFSGFAWAANCDERRQQQALAESDTRIVPGERIGPIKLGMASSEIVSALGTPDNYNKHINGDGSVFDTWMWYKSLGLVITYPAAAVERAKYVSYEAEFRNHNMTFGQVGYNDLVPVKQRFATEEGVTIGSSSYEIERLLGGNYKSPSSIQMLYDSLGLYITLTNDHRAWKIQIQLT